MQKQDLDPASLLHPDIPNTVASARVVSARAPNAFQVFWDAYPKKAKRPDAEMVWQTINPSTDLVATILNAVTWQCESPSWKDAGGRYIPSAVNWLLDKRWEDKQPVNESDAALARVLSGNARLMP